jgi:hypothetical protein
LIGIAASAAHADSFQERVCTYAPSQSQIVANIIKASGGSSAGALAVMKSAGLNAVRHSSGTYIFTGSGGYVTGTYGGAAMGPVLINVSILLASGAVTLELACSPINHPTAIARMQEIAKAYEQEIRGGLESKKLDEVQKATLDHIKRLNNSAIDVRDDAAGRIRNANSVAIDYRDTAMGYFGW